MRTEGIGIDVADVGRFRTLIKQKKHHLDKLFSKAEKKHCFSHADAATHFAGTFAAKEAIIKAQGSRSIPLAAIEIRRQKTGKPEVWIQGRRSESLLISISHTRQVACAIALQRKV